MSLYEKLLAVQKEINPIKKTETNPFFGSRYFDVNAILAQLKPILTKHGLVLNQPFWIEGVKSVLMTVVSDSESGDKVESKIYLPEVADPQKFGSAVTYFRRYALQSLFALEAEDDDAERVSQDYRKVYPSKPISPEQYQGGKKSKLPAAELEHINISNGDLDDDA